MSTSSSAPANSPSAPAAAPSSGRDANELFATLAMVGVPSDGAAGSIHAGVMQLLCTIDPNAIKQKDGSGATCKFDAGP